MICIVQEDACKSKAYVCVLNMVSNYNRTQSCCGVFKQNRLISHLITEHDGGCISNVAIMFPYVSVTNESRLEIKNLNGNMYEWIQTAKQFQTNAEQIHKSSYKKALKSHINIFWGTFVPRSELNLTCPLFVDIPIWS